MALNMTKTLTTREERAVPGGPIMSYHSWLTLTFKDEINEIIVNCDLGLFNTIPETFQAGDKRTSEVIAELQKAGHPLKQMVN